jgi:hypothetical protein
MLIFAGSSAEKRDFQPAHAASRRIGPTADIQLSMRKSVNTQPGQTEVIL